MLLVLMPLLLLVTPSPPPALPSVFTPPPILMYHRVDSSRPADAVGRQLTVSPEHFGEQLTYLKECGLTPISMAEMERRLEQHQTLDRTVVITFDDGYADQYDYALPLLRAQNVDATFYIVTGEVGRRNHLTWPQLLAMASMHMDLAAHGVQHDDLSLLTLQQQTFQITDSVQTIERELHTRVESYAYPSGRFNRETLRIVRDAGIPLAVTTDRSYVLAPENRFEMTRLRVRGDWTLHDFARALRHEMFVRHVVLR